MDPRLSYITPIFFIAFGMAIMFGIIKFRQFLKDKKAKNEIE